MNPTRLAHRFVTRRAFALLAALSVASGTLRAQQAPSEPPSPTAPRGAAASPAPRSVSEADSRSQDETVELSPFVVTTENDRGYFAANSMSGTRLNTRIEDLASSISIVTKQQLLDTAAADINDIFLYEGNTEGTHQFTDFEIVTGGAGGDIFVDRTGTSPATANRIRGLGQANISLGGFEMTGGIPIDTYNVDAVEISRGPNSSLFGLGNPAGTVNLLAGQASLSDRRARAMVQVDSYGGTRIEGSYQFPIIRDMLGVAFYAVRDDEGFKQKPAHDKTERYTLAATYRPFQRTTIRASHEFFDNRFSRPNSITPRDLVSQWVNAGSPTWDPVTGTLTRGDGSKVQANWGNRATLFTPNGGVNLYSDSFVTRMNQFIDDGQMVYFTPGYRPANLAANSTTIPGPITPAIANNQFHYYLSSGEVFPVAQQILWKPEGVSDSSIYDYRNINFAAPNYGDRNAETTLVTIDQHLLQTTEHYLALQAAYFAQDVGGWSRDFIGSSGGIASTIMVDINERLLDGSPNPFFRRPFMAGSEPQIRRQIDDSETFRLQTAYRWDLTGRDGWLRWLGTHSLVGYGERRERTTGSLGFRSYLLPGHDWYTERLPDGTMRQKVGNSYRMTYRYYLGDNSGYNVDHAPRRPANDVSANHNLRWYNAKSQQWVDETVRIEELFDANRLKRETRYTLGGIWQGNMFDDRIVPTIGYRSDRLTEFEGPSRTWYDNGYPNIEPLWDFTDPDFPYVKNYGSGDTRTAGVVVKPLRWLHVFYNQSDSFRPAGLSYDIKGNVLPNPRGEGKDYGVSLRLLDGKLIVKYNQYETLEENARTGGSSSTMTSRLQRIDFDIARASNQLPDSADRWHLEASAYRWILAKHRVADRTTLSTEQVDAFRREAWETYLAPAGLPYSYREWFMGGTTKPFADTNTARARGREVEINYNPDNYFSLKGTITQQKAYDSGVSVSNTEWMNERMEYWTQVMIPADLQRYDPSTNTWVPHTEIAGKPWWSTWDSSVVTATNMSPQRWFQQNVESNMALINARAGQKKPQTREWRFTTLARYRLAGLGTENFLRHMTVGGSLRWQDRAAIGYLADTSVTNASGQYYLFDPNRPVYDDANTEVDLMTNYDWRISEKLRCIFQVNVRNIFEDGGLRAVEVNPDGTERTFRIINPRRIVVSATLTF
jgi:outer membrane receptor protein involved in Fe transport